MVNLHSVGASLKLSATDRAWFAMEDWYDGKIVPGAIKVGGRWQPLTARIVATSKGYFHRFDSVTIVDARGYPTMRTAVKAAKAILLATPKGEIQATAEQAVNRMRKYFGEP